MKKPQKKNVIWDGLWPCEKGMLMEREFERRGLVRVDPVGTGTAEVTVLDAKGMVAAMGEADFAEKCLEHVRPEAMKMLRRKPKPAKRKKKRNPWKDFWVMSVGRDIMKPVLGAVALLAMEVLR
jgi:hypothetical protein